MEDNVKYSAGTHTNSAVRSESDETIGKLLSGAIEFHVHSAPDGLTARKSDVFELVRAAKSANMRAVVLKNKSCGTGALAQIANKYADGALAVGAITLDVSMGGLNPAAVQIEAALGSKVVWMPTYSAKNVAIMDSNGSLYPEVKEIIEIIRKNDMVLATGHISRKEKFVLIETALASGVKKVAITHPLSPSTRIDIEDQITLANMGTYMEHVWVSTKPSGPNLPSDFTKAIRAVGVEKCVLATDYGQVPNPTPVDGFGMMLGALLQEGFSVEELEYMVKRNPASLLGL